MWNIVGHWSYSGDPAASDKDAVRFIVGDVDDTDQLVSDEEINFALVEENDNLGAAALVCEHLSARFSREADKTISASGGLNTNSALSQRASAFAELGRRLRVQTAENVSPYLGGSSQSDKAAVSSNTDRVPSAFVIGQFDNQ